MNLTKEQLKELENIADYEEELVRIAKRLKDVQEDFIDGLEIQIENINKLARSLGA